MSVLIIGLAALAIIRVVAWFNDRNFAQTPTEEESARGRLCDHELLSDTDRKMAEETAARIQQLFGPKATEGVKGMDAEQRKAASDQLIKELCELYNIRIDEISYFNEDSGNCGAFVPGERKLRLNIRYLLSNQDKDIREYFDTVVHELRHAVQWSMNVENPVWQTSEETRRLWVNNWLNYQPASRNYRAYYNQPVERDARAYADFTLKGVA